MKESVLKKTTAAFLALSVFSGISMFIPQNSVNVPLKADAADIGIEDFPLSAVTMTDDYCTNAFNKEIEYLLSFDTDRLLAGFRENAGLSTNGAKKYGGWENTNIAGHAIGHYLTALAQAYQNPSITSAQRSELEKRMNTLIDGMRECQKNTKGKFGYIWAAGHPNSNNVEVQFDNVEVGKANIFDDAWVPWYTMHKLIAGIIDIYKATNNPTAKDLVSDLGDWVYNRCCKWDDNKQRTVLSIEYGGMNDCMYELYQITGKETHAAAAHKFDETALFEKVLKGGTNVLDGRHANTTIPKFIGALKRYMVLDGKTINGQKVDASAYLKYAESFWEMVTTHHTYITGGNSEWEHFGKDDILDAERTNCNCETCNSYNMLKLSRELYKITGDSKYMDFYEGTYYNSILSSQNPETGMTTYFQPMATGYFKVYSSPFDHFWCCTGSGMESFTKLGDTIYMHSDNTLYVNLYESSILDWSEQNVKIIQESSLPDGDTAVFTVDGNAKLDLRFRLPDWKADNVTIKVNGEKTAYKNIDDYAQISRDFNKGDIIEVTIPEEVKAYPLPDKNSTYGFKYGPIVLSAELGTKDMVNSSTGMWVTIPKEAITPYDNITLSKEGLSVGAFMQDINEYLVKDVNSMRFTLKGTNANLTFSPHYRQYKQRYGIYWNFLSSGTVVEDVKRAKTVVVDTVQPGYGQYENDNLHQMLENDSVGRTDDSTYRYAENGGFFKYRMAFDENAPYTVLVVKFRKADNGKTIRIRVGDTVLFSGALNYEGKEDVYEMKLIVPDETIERCAEKITADGTEYNVLDVIFNSETDEASARVCDFIYMTAVKPLYEYDSSIAYFVDCGDHNTKTLSGKDKLGYYNSLTEQVYGVDNVTGAEWGIIDDTTDKYNGSGKSSGIYTANTWCDEFNTADGRDKKSSFRYTKNQYENNIARHLDYGFTLPNGKYLVEMSFSDPWSCSKNPSVYADYGTASETLIVKNAPTDGTSVSGEFTVRNGKLTLNFRSDDKAINLNYILIKPLDEPQFEIVKNDVNLNGRFNIADIVLVQSWILGRDVKLWDINQADANADSRINSFDLSLLRSKLISIS